MVLQIISSEAFEKELKNAGSKLVLVDFYATWCGPCKMISPKLVELSKEMTNVIFLKVDVDALEDVAAKYNISAMPTFIFFKEGERVGEVVGASIEKITAMANQHR